MRTHEQLWRGPAAIAAVLMLALAGVEVGMVAVALAIVLAIRSARLRLACLVLWLPLVWWSAVPIGFTANQAAVDEPSSYDVHILCPHTQGSWVLISASWFAGC